MLRVNVLTSALALLVSATLVHAQASFRGLGDLPGGSHASIAYAVSDDGRVVVGEGTSQGGIEALRWDDGVALSLDGAPSRAYAVSADGLVVVGTSMVGQAFRWDGGVLHSLGDLPNTASGSASEADAISANGLIVVGSARNANGDFEAFRWESGAMDGLGDIIGGSFSSHAWDVSADGDVVAGAGVPQVASAEAVRWTVADGLSRLGHLPTGGSHSSARGVSADGKVFVGFSHTSLGTECFRWEDDEMTSIGDLPGGRVHCVAYSANADGSVIVGLSDAGVAGTTSAFVWAPALGMRPLKEVLVADHGLDLTGWTLEAAHDISPNGRFVVGYGRNPQGHREAWFAELGPALTIVSSDPPNGSIDPRQDFSGDGETRQGIESIRVTVSSVVRHAVTGQGVLDHTSFDVVTGIRSAPAIVDVVPDPVLLNTYHVVFDEPLTPGTWTTLIANVHRLDGLSPADHNDRITIGFLPGDVNGDGTTGPLDILALIDSMNGVEGKVRPRASTDINRGLTTNPQDIIRLIDLMNGVSTTRPWLFESLPDMP